MFYFRLRICAEGDRVNNCNPARYVWTQLSNIDTLCENRVRVLKLRRGFILTKEEDINPQKNSAFSMMDNNA